MTRVEENGIVLDELGNMAENISFGSYEKIVAFHLGSIASMLGDISKSLAILADKVESEVEK